MDWRLRSPIRCGEQVEQGDQDRRLGGWDPTIYPGSLGSGGLGSAEWLGSSDNSGRGVRVAGRRLISLIYLGEQRDYDKWLEG